MGTAPQPGTPWRVPRAQLEGNTPAVLRLPNGQRTSADIQVISLTGGLLSVSSPVVQGSQVKLMFLTGAGSVFGGAEMLPPVTKALQPFRFVSLPADDQRRLETLIWERSIQNKAEEAWIKKLRAASAQCKEPRRWRFTVAGAAGLLAIALASIAYLLFFGGLK